MVIDKKEFDKSLRCARRLYRKHSDGALSASVVITQIRAELNRLYMEHTRRLIKSTADAVIEELRSLQMQFGLDLDFTLSIYRVTRGYRGIRASIYVRNKNDYRGSAEIYIGPFDEWSEVAVHTTEELAASGRPPSFYTKRKRKRWQKVTDFDFPGLLQRMKEACEKPQSEDDLDDEIPF